MAEIEDDGIVNLKMKDVREVRGLDGGDMILDTGSPHYVKFVKQVMDYDVVPQGQMDYPL